MALGPDLLQNVFQVSQSKENRFKRNTFSNFLVCGQKSNTSNALTVNGSSAFKGEFPWHVAIYRRLRIAKMNKLSCSGTLISERMILTSDYSLICRLLSGQL
jgi:secreted trypsin-like serine protease